MRVLPRRPPLPVPGSLPARASVARPDTLGRPVGTTKGPSALDQALEGPYELLQSILGPVVTEGTWARLDGAPVALADRALLDVQGRFGPLANDPAKGHLTPGSVEEAAIGLAAEKLGLLPAPIVREKTGLAEFIDANGGLWDVKSPVSPFDGARWTFDAQHQVEKVRHDLSQHNQVLLNLTRLTPSDAQEVLSLLTTQLTQAQKANVYVLRTPEVLHHA